MVHARLRITVCRRPQPYRPQCYTPSAGTHAVKLNAFEIIIKDWWTAASRVSVCRLIIRMCYRMTEPDEVFTTVSAALRLLAERKAARIHARHTRPASSPGFVGAPSCLTTSAAALSALAFTRIAPAFSCPENHMKCSRPLRSL